jgi:hypothetical protein
VEYRKKNGGNGAMPVGTVTIGKEGYAYIKVSETEWRYEHTVVAERMLGRRLEENELVHHRSGVRHDNRELNLQVVTRERHQEIHAEAEAIGLSVMCANEWMPTVDGMAC